MTPSLARSLAIRCSILAVLGLFAAVGEHFVRDGVELHYELDEISDLLVGSIRPAVDGHEVVLDPALEQRLALVPGLRLVVLDRVDGPLLTFGEQAGVLLHFAGQAADGYFELHGQDPDGGRFGYVATRITADGTPVRIVAERAPAELRDRLIWVKMEILGEYGPFMIVSAVVSILVVFLTVRRALRPVERLSAEAAAIVPGNGRTLAVDNVPAEVVPLVSAMNGALERLQEALARERRLTADLAHTLRTPLAALRARLEGLADGPERTAFLRAVARIERLAEQLLLKARLEAGALDERSTFDLAALAREIAADAVPLLLRERKSLALHAPEDGVLRIGSRAAIERALLNLIDNAAKAAPPDSQVEIRVEADGTVLVCDRGPGFPDGEPELLLQPFRRGPTSRWQGAGLGLAIVAEAVRRHGGVPILRNRPGGGAEVGFKLPAAAPELARRDRKLAA